MLRMKTSHAKIGADDENGMKIEHKIEHKRKAKMKRTKNQSQEAVIQKNEKKMNAMSSGSLKRIREEITSFIQYHRHPSPHLRRPILVSIFLISLKGRHQASRVL